MKKLMVVGNDLMALKAVSRITARCRSHALPDCELSAVLVDATTDDPRLANHCQRLDVPVIAGPNLNSPEILGQIERIGPDLIFSLGNLQILKSDFLGIPTGGVVNFHNALLPRHAGGNACTWALFEGDAMHGVTCHYVDQGIDTGDIIAQVGFPIRESDNAFDLLLRCMEKALTLLDRVLPPLLQGRIQPLKQDFSKRTHHYFGELPNDGLIDFNWPAAKVCDMVRAMDLGPVLDEIPRAKTFYQGKPFLVEKAVCTECAPQAAPGTVIEASPDRLVVQAAGGTVEIASARDGDNRPLSPWELIRSHALEPGCVLD